MQEALPLAGHVKKFGGRKGTFLLLSSSSPAWEGDPHLCRVNPTPASRASSQTGKLRHSRVQGLA